MTVIKIQSLPDVRMNLRFLNVEQQLVASVAMLLNQVECGAVIEAGDLHRLLNGQFFITLSSYH